MLRSDRRQLCPVLERLDDRLLLSVVTITRATETNAQTVAIDYTIEAGTPVDTLTVNVVRSADTTLDPADVTVGTVVLSGAAVAPGTYTDVPLTLTSRAPGVDALAPDPAHPFVFATATGPDGMATSASFRKYVVGLISHGFEAPTGNNSTPDWETQMVASLTAAGYDMVIAFNWVAQAGVAQPGLAVAAGTLAGNQLIQAIQASVPADGVADLHLIGHSRGSVVITQAANVVQASLATIPQAAGGYWRMTYLDPHPSNAPGVVPFSAADNQAGQVALALANAFQQIAQDPFPLVVPATVADVHTYYENSPASTLLSLTEESVLNPWGTFPPGGIVPTAGAATQFETLNLTTPGMAHSVVHDWYQQNVVPGLNTASPFVNGPVATPIVATGQNIYGIEDIPLPHLVATFTDNNPLATAGQYTAMIDWGDGSTPTAGTVLGTPLLGFTVIGTHTYDEANSYVTTITIQSTSGSMTTVQGTATIKGFATNVADVPAGAAPLVVGTRSDTGATVFSFLAYDAGFTGGVSVATGDVNGDGAPDIITAPGRGLPGIVKVFDGVTQQLIGQAAPFGTRFRGGIQVTAGDVDADGKANVVAAAGNRVRVLRGDGSVLFLTNARRFRLTGPNAADLVALEIDGDGRTDVRAVHPNGSSRTVFTGRGVAEANLARRARLLRTGTITQLIANSSFAGSLPLIRQLLRMRGRR